MDFNTPKTDIETWRQLVNIHLNSLKIPDQSELLKVITELSNSISNLALRIKNIEEKKMPIELEIIQKQVLELRKKIEDVDIKLVPKSAKSLWRRK